MNHKGASKFDKQTGRASPELPPKPYPRFPWRAIAWLSLTYLIAVTGWLVWVWLT